MTKSKRRKRPQNPKGMGNSRYSEGMQELRRSSASGPHTPKTAYNRRDKSWRNDNV